MFADETDDEKNQSEGSPEEEAKTVQMSDSMGAGEEPKKARKKEKQPGDWQTVQAPKVPKPAAAKVAPEQPSPPPPLPPSAQETIVEPLSPTAKPAKTVSPPASAPAPAPAPAAKPPVTPPPPAVAAPEPAVSGTTSSVPLGSVLANMGVTNEQTQRLIVFGGGGLVLLCCLCACAAAGISIIGPLMGQ